jgi:hypothetical protein
MLKKTITFNDLDGNPVTDIFYFNLTKSEIAELELSEEGGLASMLQSIVASGDNSQIIARFKWILAKSYGVRSTDNRRFIKSDQLFEEFTQTGAYDVLFLELLTNMQATGEFIAGIIPEDLQGQLPATTDVELTEPLFEDTVKLKRPQDMTREELLEAFKAKSDENADK